MVNPGNLLVFSCHRVRLAIDITPVEQVIRAVKVSPVPNAPAIVLGVILCIPQSCNQLHIYHVGDKFLVILLVFYSSHISFYVPC